MSEQVARISRCEIRGRQLECTLWVRHENQALSRRSRVSLRSTRATLAVARSLVDPDLIVAPSCLPLHCNVSIPLWDGFAAIDGWGRCSRLRAWRCSSYCRSGTCICTASAAAHPILPLPQRITACRRRRRGSILRQTPPTTTIIARSAPRSSSSQTRWCRRRRRCRCRSVLRASSTVSAPLAPSLRRGLSPSDRALRPLLELAVGADLRLGASLICLHRRVSQDRMRRLTIF